MNEMILKALRCEANGKFYEALTIYRSLIRRGNEEAVVHFDRLKSNMLIKNRVNLKMLDLFMSDDKKDTSEFKRWLLQL